VDLAEIEAIKQLKARYFRMLDTQDWAGYRRVFTDDLAIRVENERIESGSDVTPQPLPQGGDAFIEHLQTLLTGVITVHHGHMPEIELTGEGTARGIWAMEDLLAFPDGAQMRGYGHYHETYRKEEGGWRIATLHLTRLRVDYQPGPAS